MAKKQTRRSVSIRGTTYDRIRQHCERNGVSMSEFVEEQVATFFGDGLPAVPRQSAPVRRAVAASPPPARPATKPKTRKPANGAGNGEDEKSEMSFDEMQDAARFFTF